MQWALKRAILCISGLIDTGTLISGAVSVSTSITFGRPAGDEGQPVALTPTPEVEAWAAA